MTLTRKPSIRRSFHAFGGLRVVRYLYRRRLRVLMYHRFAPSGGVEASFRRQCDYIATRFHALSLTQVMAALQAGRPLPDNATVITVDDGYRDFFEVAYPLLRAYRLPATVFVATDFLDGKDWLWVDKVQYCVRRTKLRRAQLPLPTGEIRLFDLTSSEQRDRAVSAIKEAAKKLPNEVRLAWIRKLPRLLKTDLPETAPDEFSPLSWELVRVMSANGVEFGAHTKSHPSLTQVESEGDLQEEILGSKMRIEEETGAPVTHFCYPNGDYDERSAEIVRRAGFASAVTVRRGLNPVNPDPFLLRRIGVDPGWRDVDFRHYATGSLVRAMRGL